MEKELKKRGTAEKKTPKERGKLIKNQAERERAEKQKCGESQEQQKSTEKSTDYEMQQKS